MEKLDKDPKASSSFKSLPTIFDFYTEVRCLLTAVVVLAGTGDPRATPAQHDGLYTTRAWAWTHRNYVHLAMTVSHCHG